MTVTSDNNGQRLAPSFESAGAEAARRNARVLIVDDEPTNVRLLEVILQHEGYTRVHSTTDPREVAGLLDSFEPDLVLLDLQMPYLDGFEVLEQLASLVPDGAYLPVLVLTADVSTEARRRALAAGAHDFVSKPFDLVEVALRIRNLLHTRLLHLQMQGHNLLLEEKIRERTAELEATQARQLALQDEFLSHVSHELRTPLAATYQFVRIMLDGLAGDVTEEQREYLGVVDRNVTALKRMVNELFEATRAHIGKVSLDLSQTSLHDVVAEVAATFAPSAAAQGIELSWDVSEELPAAYADRHRIRQVLVNLVGNAIKFTPPGGRIQLVATFWPEDPDFLRISVLDSGTGVSPEHHDVIFDRLRQVDSVEGNRKGLGLGLYISKEIVAGHGGRIWVESERGHGSAFHFTLPAFSLPNLLLPVISGQEKPSSPVALLTVTYPAEQQRDLARRVLEAVPLGLVLPDGAAAQENRRLFAVAAVGQVEALAYTRRIRDELAAEPAFDSGRADVSFQMVEPGEEASTAVEAAEILAARVGALLSGARSGNGGHGSGAHGSGGHGSGGHG